MATLACSVLLDYHMMVGCDFHDALAIPPLVLPPNLPHVVFHPLGIATFTSQQTDMPKVIQAGKRPVMQRGTDIGMGVPHVPIPPVPLNVLFPLHMISSGSISEFGAFTVLMQNKPVATAFPMVYATMNLNCQGPSTIPFPSTTDVVIAFPNSAVFAGMSPADILASLLALAMDVALQTALNLAWKGYGSLVSKAVFPQFMRALTSTFGRTMVGNITSILFSQFGFGSPVGYSAGYTPFGGGYGELRDDFVRQQAAKMQEYFNSSESH